MRITVRHLRRIIKEELDQAYAGNLPAYNTEKDEEKDKDDPTHSFKTIEKFHTSPMFSGKAINAFKHFKTPIWILPVKVYDVARGEIADDFRRTEVYDDLTKIKNVLSNGGYPQETIDRVQEIVSSGGTVMISSIGRMVKGRLPSPWMLIHSLFDIGDDMAGFFRTTFKMIERNLFNFINKPNQKRFFTGPEFVKKFLTMGSARTGQLSDSPDDIISEIMTQELTTTKGFNFKDPNEVYEESSGEVPLEYYEEMFNRLKIIKEKLAAENLKQKFDEMIAGKLITIANIL